MNRKRYLTLYTGRVWRRSVNIFKTKPKPSGYLRLSISISWCCLCSLKMEGCSLTIILCFLSIYSGWRPFITIIMPIRCLISIKIKSLASIIRIIVLMQRKIKNKIKILSLSSPLSSLTSSPPRKEASFLRIYWLNSGGYWVTWIYCRKVLRNTKFHCQE